MQIDGRIWSMLSADARNDYLNWYGKVYITFGGQAQEVVLERPPETVFSAVTQQRTGKQTQPN